MHTNVLCRFSLCGLEACPVCQLKTSHVLAFRNRSRATGMDCTPLVNTPYLPSGTAHAIVGFQCKEDRNGSKLSKETPQLRALGWSSLHGCLLIYREVTMNKLPEVTRRTSLSCTGGEQEAMVTHRNREIPIRHKEIFLLWDNFSLEMVN